MNNLSKIKLIVLDVDGTLTEGGVFMDNEGNEFKKFNIKDGAGIVLAQKVGYDFMILTGRTSKCVQRRAADLKIKYLEQGVTDKVGYLKRFMTEHNISAENIAYVGDDLIDLGPMRIVGISACPQNAVSEVKAECDYIIPFDGGKGVVRSFLEMILKENGQWEDAISKLYNFQL